MPIMLLFKNIKGERIDPVNHTLEIMKTYPYAEIHIGTDSQNINKERLVAAPDCGLGHLSRDLSIKKLKIMVEAVKNF